MIFVQLYSSSPEGEEVWEVREFFTSSLKSLLLQEKGVQNNFITFAVNTSTYFY